MTFEMSCAEATVLKGKSRGDFTTGATKDTFCASSALFEEAGLGTPGKGNCGLGLYQLSKCWTV